MSNLLQKASIITTPTAYDTGKILSVKPVETYGPELVTNGDFDTDSGWEKGTGWTISGGKANSDGTQSVSYLRQNNIVNLTSLYRIKFTVSNSTSGTLKYIKGNGGAATIVTNNGEYSFETTWDGSSPDLVFQSLNFVGSIDNVSVKEVLNADFDFTRNSSATRVGSNGLIQDVASNLPRIDYTGGVGSWKFEPQRTNSFPYSEDFANSDWTKDRLSITGNNIISPDGTLNASKITENTGNGTHRISDTIIVSGTNVAYTQSVFAKSGGNGRYLRMFRGSGTYNNAVFDLENGTVVAQGGSRIINTKIEKYPNGWYRCISTYTTQFGNIATYYGLQNGNTDSYQGDGTSHIYLWGAQLEEGSYSTSIIPTSGSATTRSADVANNAGSSDLISSTGGVLYAEISALADDFANYKFISIYDGTYNNFCDIYYGDASNRISARFRSGGGSVINMFFAVSDVTASNKVAISWKANEFKFFINGVSRGLNTSGATPVGLNKLDFHQVSNSNSFYGNTKCVGVFKEALTDLELECLSSWMSFSDMGIALGYTVE